MCTICIFIEAFKPYWFSLYHINICNFILIFYIWLVSMFDRFNFRNLPRKDLVKIMKIKVNIDFFDRFGVDIWKKYLELKAFHSIGIQNILKQNKCIIYMKKSQSTV